MRDVGRDTNGFTFGMRKCILGGLDVGGAGRAVGRHG
jgi:hypothetical protein